MNNPHPENPWPEKNSIFFDIRPNVRSSAMGKAGRAYIRCALHLSKQTKLAPRAMSALPPKADMCGATRDVRFGPKADMCGAQAHVCFSWAVAMSAHLELSDG